MLVSEVGCDVLSNKQKMAAALYSFKWRRQRSKKTNRVIVQADQVRSIEAGIVAIHPLSALTRPRKSHAHLARLRPLWLSCVRVLQMGMGRHAAATAGGDTLRSELAALQRALFKGSAGKLKNAWMPAYDRMAKKHGQVVVDNMLLHFDDDVNRIRVCYCLTEDGQPRKVGMQDKSGGRVYVTIVRADGSVEELVSEPGALLILWVPSGGFYAMSVRHASSTLHQKQSHPLCTTHHLPQHQRSPLHVCQGPGSGAAHEDGGLQWQHAVYPCESASVVPILDHYVPVEEQPKQMAAARDELVRRGKARVRSGAVWSPASLPNMRKVVDFETKESDNMDGMGKTVAFYWCVGPAYSLNASRACSARGSKPSPLPKSACAHPCFAGSACARARSSMLSARSRRCIARGHASLVLASPQASQAIPCSAIPLPCLAGFSGPTRLALLTSLASYRRSTLMS